MLHTLGWLACVVYSTIPLFWLMIHPRAHKWREKERSPFRLLLPAWLTMWIGVAALTGPWRHITLYRSAYAWIPAVLLFALGIFIYSRSGSHFTLAHLGGLPEVRASHRDDRLITTGIRARVRHPVYLAHLLEMLAWSLGTGLLVCWILTAFAIATGVVMIRMEDAELEKRFGAEFRKYKKAVPAVWPRYQKPPLPKLSCDGQWIRYQVVNSGEWKIPVSDLICVAEYTTEAGPFVDDYFLVFGVSDSRWYEASFYSEGRHETIKALGTSLACELQLGLAHSTQFVPRILWPTGLAGQPLFVEKKLNPELEKFRPRPL